MAHAQGDLGRGFDGLSLSGLRSKRCVRVWRCARAFSSGRDVLLCSSGPSSQEDWRSGSWGRCLREESGRIEAFRFGPVRGMGLHPPAPRAPRFAFCRHRPVAERNGHAIDIDALGENRTVVDGDVPHVIWTRSTRKLRCTTNRCMEIVAVEGEMAFQHGWRGRLERDVWSGSDATCGGERIATGARICRRHSCCDERRLRLYALPALGRIGEILQSLSPNAGSLRQHGRPVSCPRLRSR